MELISEGTVYTKGYGFRAVAEAMARKYQAETLRRNECGKYGHWLTDQDGKAGWNFLPSLREEILEAVMALSSVSPSEELSSSCLHIRAFRLVTVRQIGYFSYQPNDEFLA